MRTLQRGFALIRRFGLGGLLLVPLCFAPGTQPQATVVTNPSGYATTVFLFAGTDGYRVDFVEGAYDDVFAPGTEFPNAGLIGDGVTAELNAAGRPLLPPTIFGEETVDYFIPAFLTSGGVSTYHGRCDIGAVTLCVSSWFQPIGAPILPLDFPVSPFAQGFTSGIPGEGFIVWGVPTLLTPSPVPLPAALPLFGSALAMLGIVGWRRRRQAGG